MPNIKSASKRDEMAKAQAVLNKARKSEMKTVIKKFDLKADEGDKAAAQAAYVLAVKAVDQAASDNLIHKNNAAHKKSRLTKKLNSMA